MKPPKIMGMCEAAIKGYTYYQCNINKRPRTLYIRTLIVIMAVHNYIFKLVDLSWNFQVASEIHSFKEKAFMRFKTGCG